MKAEEIIRLGGLVFDRIEEGFDHYESEVITKSSPELYQILMEMIQKNGWENSFVDFYFGRLLKEEQERILQVVPVYWHDILKQYEENQEIAYCVSKDAIIGLCRQTAAALAKQKIRVNCINPGATDTGYLMPESDSYQMVASMFPSGRWGMPEDAAKLVQFLQSDFSAWITGQIIASEGGFDRYREC